MNVKSGYKQSDVGVIPEDWEVKPLGELGKFKNGINKGKEDFGHGSPFVNLMDVFGVPRVSNSTTELGLVNTTKEEQKLYDLKSGDVLFVRSSVKPDGVGLTTLIPEDLPETVFSGFLIRYRDDGSLEHGFREHCFWAEDFRSRLISSSTVSANTNINQEALKRLRIAFPKSSQEQRAIAKALSDADALLSAMDRQIAKKRNVKHAAMQRLLVGQTHLPGFQGAWETKRLGDLAEIISGGTPRTTEPAYWNGGIKWCTPTDITGCSSKYLFNTERSISRLGLVSSGTRMLPAGALLLCSRATIGELKIAGAPVCTNQGFKSLICNQKVHNEFLYYKLLTMKAQMVERSFGSTFLEISMPNVAALELSVPPPTEQLAIAAVLSDMDRELVALEQRREKTRAIKQGMMQQLLTGKVRLI